MVSHPCCLEVVEGGVFHYLVSELMMVDVRLANTQGALEKGRNP